MTVKYIYGSFLGPTVSLLTTSAVAPTLSSLAVSCHSTKKWHDLQDESGSTMMFQCNQNRNIIFWNVRLANKIFIIIVLTLSTIEIRKIFFNKDLLIENVTWKTTRSVLVSIIKNRHFQKLSKHLLNDPTFATM